MRRVENTMGSKLPHIVNICYKIYNMEKCDVANGTRIRNLIILSVCIMSIISKYDVKYTIMENNGIGVYIRVHTWARNVSGCTKKRQAATWLQVSTHNSKHQYAGKRCTPKWQNLYSEESAKASIQHCTFTLYMRKTNKYIMTICENEQE